MSNKIRGSVTVEATIVITTILIVLYITVYCSILVYHKALLETVAAKATSQGALIWLDSRADINTGKPESHLKKDSIYYRLFNDGSRSYKETLGFAQISDLEDPKDLQDVKIYKIRELILSEIRKGIIKAGSTQLEIHYNNTLLQRKIEVTIIQYVEIPLGWIKAVTDGNKTLAIKGHSVSVIVEPAEYIRNVDLISEYIHKTDKTFNIKRKIDDIKNIIFKNREIY